ncbi:hypothetical protein FRB96_002666 [Tulasnella sp. 330]|nr:hypothetical protein FRB96_002666 [Tulasnella sp. 330]
MFAAASHHALTVGVVPSPAIGNILVNVCSKNVNLSGWKHLIPSTMQAEPFSTQGDSFIGVVATVERGIRDRNLNVGDTVAGYVSGGSWVDTVDGRQAYLSIQPSCLWKLSAAATKELGVLAPVINDGCIIV